MPRPPRYSKESLEPIVKKSISVAAVLRELGLKQSGGNQQLINSRIKQWNIDTSHFLGQGHLKGKTHDWSGRSDTELFAKNTAFHSTLHKTRLIKSGREYKCVGVECGISEWKGKPLTLHVDHVSGDRTDNRKSNLRFLCPNCHQQTDTWGRK
jgi:hypothetical protein